MKLRSRLLIRSNALIPRKGQQVLPLVAFMIAASAASAAGRPAQPAGNAERIVLAQADTQTSSRGMVQLMNQLDGLNIELNKLRGKIEELGNSILNAEKRQKDMYLDLDTRLRRIEQQSTAGAAESKKNADALAALEERIRKLEQAAASRAAIPAPVNTAAGNDAPTPGTITVTAAPPGMAASQSARPVSPATTSGGDAVVQRAYETAMADYRTGNYQAAISGFQSVVRQYPQHPLAANAQYWVGDAYYQLRDYRSAIDAQRQLVSSYPDSPKAADAMLNIGSAQLGLGDVAATREAWDDLIARYPASEAAEKARQRLARLR